MPSSAVQKDVKKKPEEFFKAFQDTINEKVSLPHLVMAKFTNNAYTLLTLVKKYEDKSPNFAFQVATKILESKDVFTDTEVIRQKLTTSFFRTPYAEALAKSSNEKIALKALDWLDENKSNWWKKNNLLPLSKLIETEAAKKRAFKIYAEADTRHWEETEQPKDRPSMEIEELIKKSQIRENNREIRPNYKKG